MDNRPDIWRRLQDHEMTPPKELFDRLLHAFRATDARTDNPPADHPSLPAPAEDGIRSLARLQQYTTPPPAFIHTAIRNSIIGSGPRRFGWFPRFRFFYAAVAACLVIVFGVVVYRMNTSHQPHIKDVVRKTTMPGPVSPAQQGTPAPLTPAEDSSGATTAVTSDATDSTISGSTVANITGIITRQPAWYIDHHPFPLVDNDLLITLTSLKYQEVADHVSKAGDQAMKVHLDQFTNIVISTQVVAMIKEMYRTRSNGKPTRKARKMKERLEDWKKADEKHFDSTAFFNAADPIDLAEFIFK
jgi:hypothetical protein